MRWFKPARQSQVRNNDRLRPHLEALESREVPAGLFLQGQSFVDTNQNGVREATESGLAGATIELRSQDGTTLLATTTTNASGSWRFDDTSVTGDLLAGTYRVVQIAPTGFASNAANADLWKLGGATVINPKTIEVVLADTVANPLTLTYNGLGTSATLWMTLTDPISIFDGNGDGTFGVFTGQLNISLTGGNFTSPTAFISFCLDLTHRLPTNPNTAQVTPRSEPVAPTLTVNAGRMAYLYNHHGINGFSGTNAALDAAALQVALWELCYDTGAGDLSAGKYTFLYVNGQTANSPDSTYIRDKANEFLTKSIGKDELAVFLDGPATATQLTIIGGSLNFANVTEAKLGNFVWEDTNGNGVQDTGENGVNGVQVKLLDSNGTVIATTTTANASDGDGFYQFTGLAPGTYSVQFVPTGYDFTLANQGGDDALDSDADPDTGKTGTYTLAAGEYNDTVDAGLVRLARLGDFVWEDKNGNGMQDDGNAGIDGVVLELYDPTTGNTVATTTTVTNAGIKGYYQFAGLRPGSYGVRVAASNFTGSGPLVGYNATETTAWAVSVELDSNDPTGTTTTLASGGSDQTLDFGFLRPAALGDFVWIDANKNGVQDTGEQGLAGVVVFLLDGNGNAVLDGNGDAVTATTDSNGFYKFENLAPGSYRVQFVVPGAYTVTTANAGGDDATDSDIDATGQTGVYTLESGETNLTVDAGLYLKEDTTCYTISGYKFYDKNADGVWDKDGLDNVLGTKDDEIGLSGWRIYVDANNNGKYDCGEKYDYTDSTGYYEIECLPAGTYVVREQMQCGWVRTTDERIVVTLQNGQNATNVNFGNFKGDLVMTGDTATIGFWQNKNGQALIRSLNGSKYSTNLGGWLARNFGNIYGHLAGKSNDYIANYFVTLFKQTGMKLSAQVLATALAVYVTDSDLAGGRYAARYGFTVTSAGIANNYFNIGTSGAAFGVADNSVLTVWEILKRTNAQYTNGKFWGGNATLQEMGNRVFSGINEQGDIV